MSFSQIAALFCSLFVCITVTSSITSGISFAAPAQLTQKPSAAPTSKPSQIDVKVVATAPDGSLSSDKLVYKGDCYDKRYHLQYVFNARASGTYTYKEIFGGKDNGSVSSIVFDKVGEQVVDTGVPTEGVKDLSIQIQITKPVQFSSNKVILSSECKADETSAIQPKKQPKKSIDKSIANTATPTSDPNLSTGSVPLPGKCYSFDGNSMRVADFKGKPSLVVDAGGSVRSLYVARNSAEANLALAAAKAHSLTDVCYAGKSVSFSYFLSSGSFPRGRYEGEKCFKFNPGAIVVAEQPIKSKSNPGKSSGTYWALMDGVKQIRGFGSTEEGKLTAYEALSIIKAYNFSELCSTGGFSYFIGK